MVPFDGLIPSLVNASGFLEPKYLDNIVKMLIFSFFFTRLYTVPIMKRKELTRNV